jgi:hypothetical protein
MMKSFEIVRTKDLQSFYIIANDPLDAILKHRQNLDKIREDKKTRLFDTGNSYILIHNNDVYCLVYRIKNNKSQFSH